MSDERAEKQDELRRSPMIVDTDIGGDADDALAVTAAARQVPEFTLLLTSDENKGERARFARNLLDLLGREDILTVAGPDLSESPLYCVEGLIPETIPAQPTDVLTAVRKVCATTAGPVRWVGMGPLTNLAHVLAQAPELGKQLRVTQMGGALRYRNPERAEHNIRMDVPAAHAVLKAVAEGTLPAPEFIASEITFTPEIEITAKSALYQDLRDSGAPVWAGLLADHLERWFARTRFAGTMQHDALTLSAALELPFVESGRLRIEMDEIGRTTQAETGVPLQWSRSAQYGPFMEWLTRALLGPAVATQDGRDTTPRPPR